MGRAHSKMKLLPHVRQDQRARIAIPIVHGIDVLLAEKPVTARITLDASSDREKVDEREFWRISPKKTRGRIATDEEATQYAITRLPVTLFEIKWKVKGDALLVWGDRCFSWG